MKELTNHFWAFKYRGIGLSLANYEVVPEKENAKTKILTKKYLSK